MTLPWLEPTWQLFLQRVEQGRLAHALLLCGPPGLGKLDLARDMAAYLLCLRPGQGACGECRSCKLLKGGAHPDRTEIAPDEGKHQIRVDQVRELGGTLALTTTISARKLALIAPAEAMNVHAANALLKNLEEPPGNTVMILVSHDPARLPVTVRSRCQALPAAAPDPAATLAWLVSESGLDADHAAQALAAGGGSPLTALAIIEEGALGTFEGLRERLVGLLGQPRAVAACAAGLEEVDPDMLWRWLSLSAASAARASLAVTPTQPDWPGPETGRRLRGRCLLGLQRQADRNRALALSPVRQDLLLREWLLEWARQPLAGTR